jgi:hypothetical protein
MSKILHNARGITADDIVKWMIANDRDAGDFRLCSDDMEPLVMANFDDEYEEIYLSDTYAEAEEAKTE